MKWITRAQTLLTLAAWLAVPLLTMGADASGKDGYLAKLKENELAAQPKDSSTRIYRLIISPTWGNLHCLRLQNTEKGGLLVTKHLDGQAGYGKGPLVKTKRAALSPDEFAEFEKLVANSGYEKMSLKDPDQGLDGDGWTLEVSKPGFHHKAFRWCPNAYDPKKRGTTGYVEVFRWAAGKASVTGAITNKGYSVFAR
jgi:hypothetical protein